MGRRHADPGTRHRKDEFPTQKVLNSYSEEIAPNHVLQMPQIVYL